MKLKQLQLFAVLVAKFARGQTGIQLVQAGNGLLLVWLLAIEDFAKYTVFVAAMGFTSQIVGFGLMPTALSLIGERRSDKAVVGRYMFAAVRLRHWLLLLIAPLGLGLLWGSSGQIASSAGPVFILSMLLLLANYFSASNDLLAAPLQMVGRLGPIYRSAFLSEVARSVSLLALFLSGVLSAVSAAAVAVAGVSINNLLLARHSAQYVLKPATSPRQEQRQLFRLTVPWLPSLVFNAMESQITVVISGLLGNATQVASAGALGRLSRLFMFVKASNPMIIGPLVARTNDKTLWKRLTLVLACALSLSLLMGVTGLLMPELLVRILGPNYKELESVVYLATFGGGLAYLMSVLGTIVIYRHWVAWWTSAMTVGLVICSVAAGAYWLDLRSLSGVLILALLTTCARIMSLVVTIAVARCCPQWLRNA